MLEISTKTQYFKRKKKSSDVAKELQSYQDSQTYQQKSEKNLYKYIKNSYFLLQVLYTTMVMVHFSIQLEDSPVKIEQSNMTSLKTDQAYLDKSHKYKQFLQANLWLCETQCMENMTFRMQVWTCPILLYR